LELLELDGVPSDGTTVAYLIFTCYFGFDWMFALAKLTLLLAKRWAEVRELLNVV